MKRYFVVFQLIVLFFLGVYSQGTTLFLPFDATTLTKEQQYSNPTYLAYPLILETQIPEIRCVIDGSVDLGLSVFWGENNLGANTPEDYGDYFAWGETSVKGIYSWKTYKYCNGSETTLTKYCYDNAYGTVDDKLILGSEDDAAVVNLGGFWRIPTIDEWTELYEKCNWMWVVQNGINGYKITGPSGNSIFLPVAGFIFNKSSYYLGSDGFYWTNSLHINDESKSFDASGVSMSFDKINLSYHGLRCVGRSIRPICLGESNYQVIEDIDTICWQSTYEFKGYSYPIPSCETFENVDYIDYVLSYYDKKNCVVYKRNLVIVPEKRTEINATICQGEIYRLNGQVYTTSGDYEQTLIASNGCDSVVTLHLTVNKSVATEFSEIACDSYTWNGQVYTSSNDYVQIFTAANGCDSVVTLHLTVNKSVATEFSEIACDSYTWNNQIYTTSGDYEQTFMTINGCDSVVTLHLIVLTTVAYDTTVVVVGSDEIPYLWYGQEYLTTGEYVHSDSYVSVDCDSAIHVLNLTVLTTGVIDEQEKQLCESELPYSWYDQSLTAAGKYVYIEKYAGTTIDSVLHILDFSVIETTYGEENIFVCHGDTCVWNNEQYTESGDYTITISSFKGCDSIVTLKLTVLPEIIAPEENISICSGESYIWQGEEYTKTGVYRDTLESYQGCDSIVTLNLTILPSYSSGMNATIKPGDSYQWRGESYSVPGVYFDKLLTVDGCDSVFTLMLIVEEVEDVVVDAINIAEQCAGTGVMDVEIILQQGSVDSVSFEFSQAAIDAGFSNVTLLYSELLEVHYDNVRAGEYAVTISGFYGNVEVFKYEKKLTFLYPSTVLKQHWNDVVAVLTYNYNGGYNFVAFQWYKNGAILPGETHSYIHQPLEFGAEYSALLTEDNGTQLMTCPLVATEHIDISLYPTLLNNGQRVKCKVSEMAIVCIYDMLGKLILEVNVEPGETELEIPYAAGVYMAKIITVSNEERNIKLIMQ